ncbi:MAG: hypothetical protein IJC31_06180 [Spirochaetaceae bacterium]|nr:hypothetical protein [Spirochaetaceae bacterium]
MSIYVEGREVSSLPRSTSWMQRYTRVCRLIKRYRHDSCLLRFYSRAYHGLIYKG